MSERKEAIINVRAPRDLRDKLDAVAVAEGRSLAQVVVQRLEASFRDADILATIREMMAPRPVMIQHMAPLGGYRFQNDMCQQPGYASGLGSSGNQMPAGYGNAVGNSQMLSADYIHAALTKKVEPVD